MPPLVSPEYLTCSGCGKKIGIAFIASIGATHQLIAECRCIECARESIRKEKDKIEAEILKGNETLQRTLDWLKK